MDKNKAYHDRLSMALDDLLRCDRYCKKMIQLPIGESFTDERTIYESLFVAMVITYGRVFNSSKSNNPEHNETVSQRFGKFRINAVQKLEKKLSKLHYRLIDKRDTAIAHSDGSSRNYQHYGNTPMAIGRNPYYPYDHEEITWVIELLDYLKSFIGKEQSRVGNYAFANNIFGEKSKAT